MREKKLLLRHGVKNLPRKLRSGDSSYDSMYISLKLIFAYLCLSENRLYVVTSYGPLLFASAFSETNELHARAKERRPRVLNSGEKTPVERSSSLLVLLLLAS